MILLVIIFLLFGDSLCAFGLWGTREAEPIMQISSDGTKTLVIKGALISIKPIESQYGTPRFQLEVFNSNVQYDVGIMFGRLEAGSIIGFRMVGEWLYGFRGAIMNRRREDWEIIKPGQRRTMIFPAGPDDEFRLVVSRKYQNERYFVASYDWPSSKVGFSLSVFGIETGAENSSDIGEMDGSETEVAENVDELENSNERNLASVVDAASQESREARRSNDRLDRLETTVGDLGQSVSQIRDDLDGIKETMVQMPYQPIQPLSEMPQQTVARVQTTQPEIRRDEVAQPPWEVEKSKKLRQDFNKIMAAGSKPPVGSKVEKLDKGAEKLDQVSLNKGTETQKPVSESGASEKSQTQARETERLLAMMNQQRKAAGFNSLKMAASEFLARAEAQAAQNAKTGKPRVVSNGLETYNQSKYNSADKLFGILSASGGARNLFLNPQATEVAIGWKEKTGAWCLWFY